jgi:uncharacterized membrane protein YeaQ/YmgE (transglycosylase-associated protein family)
MRCQERDGAFFAGVTWASLFEFVLRPAPLAALGVCESEVKAKTISRRSALENTEERGRMGIIGWIILGLLAGAIAKAILPGDDPGGFIVTGLIGIVGAVIGGLIAKALGFGDPIDEFFDWSTWIAAIIGAILLLLIYRLIVGRSTRGRTAY